MSEDITQDKRLLSIDTPLGPEVLLLHSFTGYEAISQPFRFQLALRSKDPDIDFHALIGRNVTVRLALTDDAEAHKERLFNGLISRFGQLPSEGRLARYQAEMVPWLWFLSQTADCRIFQNQTVPDIVQQVFQEHGFSEVENRLSRKYERWEYCVQYRETGLNFVMRLLEHEGIFFFFIHEPGKHILVLADSPQAHKPCPVVSTVNYDSEAEQGGSQTPDTISAWYYEQRLRPNAYSLSDFDFTKAPYPVSAHVKSTLDQEESQEREIHDHADGHEKRPSLERLAKIRMEENEAQHTVITGASRARTLGAGYRFTLGEHDRSDQNVAYVLTEVEHRAQNDAFYSGIGSQTGSYTNTFVCIPADIPFRPARVTPKPLIKSSQTAVVVGPPGEEVYTDQYGRVKVQFPWHREGKRNEKSSCWIRVSYPWAGQGWGGIFIPRVGQEVIVTFLEGNPDRPLITGCLYNADQMPPYPLPSNSRVSGFKSHIKNGGSNEIVMDDDEGTIRLENAGGSITLAPKGITIKGPGGTITIGADGIGIDSQGNTIRLGPNGITIHGTTVTIRGGMVYIN